MKKKILSVVLALSLISLAGCGSLSSETSDATETLEEEISDTDEEETGESADTSSTEDIEDTDATENENADTGSENSGEVSAVSATLEDPAEVGEWVEITKYSTVDEEYHTCYFRITSVDREEESVQTVIDLYNEEKGYEYISVLEDDDLEYGVFYYEVYFPEDFPEQDYGITSADLSSFSICNLEDYGGIEYEGVSYIGLSCWDISPDLELEEKMHAGDTFTEGAQVFTMIKDYTDFLFTTYYPDDSGENVHVYVKS